MSMPHVQCRQDCESYPDIPDRTPPSFPYNNTPIYIEQENSEWNGFMLTATVTSIGCVFIVTVVAYYVYFRWYSNTLRQAERFRRERRIGISRARQFHLRSAAEDYSLTSPRDGLRSSMVDALPVLVYKPESFEYGLRCAVCLCEFQENEKARMLPSCNHSFHVDCIDMWFYSHSTCPLCRASVEAQSDETVESGHTQIEVSVGEEADGKIIINSTSGSAAAEQNNECEESKETEEGGGPQVAIDIPSREK